VIERYTLGEQIAACFGWRQVNAFFLFERRQGFNFDQGDLPIWAGLVGIQAGTQEVAVALQTSAGDDNCLRDALQRLAGATGDKEPNQLALEHFSLLILC
jgi:hypothetical protein